MPNLGLRCRRSPMLRHHLRNGNLLENNRLIMCLRISSWVCPVGEPAVFAGGLPGTDSMEILSLLTMFQRNMYTLVEIHLTWCRTVFLPCRYAENLRKGWRNRCSIGTCTPESGRYGNETDMPCWASNWAGPTAGGRVNDGSNGDVPLEHVHLDLEILRMVRFCWGCLLPLLKDCRY